MITSRMRQLGRLRLEDSEKDVDPGRLGSHIILIGQLLMNFGKISKMACYNQDHIYNLYATGLRTPSTV